MKEKKNLDEALEKIALLEKENAELKENWSITKRERPVADKSIMLSGLLSTMIL